MNLNELAYSRGVHQAMDKFAATFAPVAPVKPMGMPGAQSAVMPNAAPPAIGGIGGRIPAPMGAPAAAAAPAAPGMGLQTNPVLSTGDKPAVSPLSLSGASAVQGAARSITTQGSGA